MRPLRVFVLLAIPTAAALGNASSFVPGSTCDDDADAQVALLGKRLLVMELEWVPFAYRDATAPNGWGGYNLELIDELATLLGFRYDIIDVGYPDAQAGETWTSHAIANIDNGDVLMSFWYKNSARLKKVVFLDGHISVSPVLIALREPAAKANAWSWSSLTSFLAPFTWGLWLCLMALVLLSGLMDYLLERRTTLDADLFSSMYEYAAGILWGGFQYPLTGASALFQVITGFILLIVVSTYTANLAAFITLSASESLSVTSVDSAITNSHALCMEEGAYNARVSAQYPRMAYELLLEANSAADRLINKQGCEGILAPASFYDGWRTDPKYCRMEIVETLFPDVAGWMSSKKSQCVTNALNYGLHELKLRGVIDRLFLKHFPVLSCASADDPAELDALEEEPDSSRRRLSDVSQPQERRQLKTSPADSGSTDDALLQPIGISDCMGLFLLWGIISAGLILWTYGKGPLKRGCKLALMKLKPGMRSHHMAGDHGEEGPQRYADNEMGILRELLRQQGEMNKTVSSLSQHMGLEPKQAPVSTTATHMWST